MSSRFSGRVTRLENVQTNPRERVMVFWQWFNALVAKDESAASNAWDAMDPEDREDLLKAMNEPLSMDPLEAACRAAGLPID